MLGGKTLHSVFLTALMLTLTKKKKKNFLYVKLGNDKNLRNVLFGYILSFKFGLSLVKRYVEHHVLFTT